MKDYYENLRISPSASSLEIKRAYRRLAVQYHPDKNHDPSAEALFKEINEAYDVLSDPAKKSNYDWRVQNPFSNIVVETPPPTPAHRDPAYRRRTRPAGYKSETQQLRELIQEYLPHALWICRIGLVVSCLFALDYVLPYRSKTEKVVDRVAVRNHRGGFQYYKLITESGRRIKTYGPRAEVNQTMDYELTLVYSTVMSISVDGTKYALGYIYRGLILFPAGVFIFSVLGIYFRKSTEFAFNAAVVTGILMIIFLFLVF